MYKCQNFHFENITLKRLAKYNMCILVSSNSRLWSDYFENSRFCEKLNGSDFASNQLFNRDKFLLNRPYSKCTYTLTMIFFTNQTLGFLFFLKFIPKTVAYVSSAKFTICRN